MATDQEIRDAGFKYIPQQKYLLNPFTLPTTDDDSDDGGNGTPSANMGGNPEGFSVYNPDPNRTRNIDQYSPFNYNRAMRDTNKFGETVMPNPDLYYSKELEGIPGMVQGYMKNSLPGRFLGRIKSGIESLLPVNRRAIYENELLGQGIALDDIGRIVSDGGNYDTADNVMAGYNANKVTAETFEKRRNMINKTIERKLKADPTYDRSYLDNRLGALDAAESKMLGTATDRADIVFDAKSLKKNPDYISESAKLDINNMINQEKEEDENIIDPNTLRYITKKKAAAAAIENAGTALDPPNTTGATDTSIYVPGGTVYANQNDPSSVSTSGLTYNQGGGQDGSYDFVEQNFGGNQNQGGNNYGGPGNTTDASGGTEEQDRFMANGGRVYFFDGGRVAVMNGGLVSLL